MSHFSVRSIARLSTCDQRLFDLFIEVVKHRDCTVLEGFRPQEVQDKYFAEGKSKLKWPHGKHNTQPLSHAVDVAPYINKTISWATSDCIEFAQFVLATAKKMGIELRWGGDWDGDGDRSDQTFNDLVHFELK